jgi:HNH endonuclease/NUMOD4 motif/Helix-turn-helix domain of resolvase
MNLKQLEVFERWLPVVGHEGYYEVSEWGRVRRVARGHGAKVGRILSPRARNGYPSVHLGGKSHYVHRLVATAFLGPSEHEVDHIDGNRTNNVLPNLRYLTKTDNIRGSRERLGSAYSPGGGIKLTDAQVNEARRLYLEGMTQLQIAKHFGVSRSGIQSIVSGKRRHRLRLFSGRSAETG